MSMKQTLYIITLCCTTLFFGCNGEGDSLVPTEGHKKTRVKLSGSLPVMGITTRSGDDARGEGMIHPLLKNEEDRTGLPAKQLEVGIVTIEFGTIDNSTPPDVLDWKDLGNEPYLDRGFFGGQIPGDDPVNYADDPDDDSGATPDTHASAVWTGNIEYTNRDGDAIQQLFYDESGIYYYLVVVYPYAFIDDLENVDEEGNGALILTSSGASVIFNVDGSQDIMASTMGGGNIEHPYIDPLTFSHKLTALRCYFVAESELAEMRYGNIKSVELIDQPSQIGLNIGKQANGESDALFNAKPNIKADYLPVRSTEEALLLPYPLDEETPATPVEFGYMLAMPAQTYTFRIITEVRNEANPLYVSYTFPAGLPLAGTAYKLTFTMVETADIVLEVAAAEEWTFEQTFD